MDVAEETAEAVGTGLSFTIVILLALAAYILTRFILLRILVRFYARTKSKAGEILLEKGVFQRLTLLVPAVVIYSTLHRWDARHLLLDALCGRVRGPEATLGHRKGGGTAMTEALSLLFNLSVLIFVLASMFGLGLSLTLKQVLAPMRNVSLVLKALAANLYRTKDTHHESQATQRRGHCRPRRQDPGRGQSCRGGPGGG
jgi:hypothetical protein